MANLSANDQKALEGLSKQWFDQKAAGATQSELDAIHAQAEAIRAQYNYSGGVDGSQYIPLSTGTQPKSVAQGAASQDAMINQMYDAQRRQALAQLESSYQSSLTDLDAAKAKIPGLYNTARNQTAAASEQSRAAFNEQAAAYGLNSGTGSQASLALGNQLTGNLSTLHANEAQANTDIETHRLKLQQQYNAAVSEAMASSDFARAQALLSEAQRVDNSLLAASQLQASYDNLYYQQQLERAQQNAAFGDFSRLEGYYSPTAIANMERQWKYNNPLLAAALR
jgi:hypothetical protein